MVKSTSPWKASASVDTDKNGNLLLTYDQAARLLQVSKRTIERMIKSKELPVIYVRSSPRIKGAALREWMDNADAARKKED
jgi:excisionase family DNA binding protein